MISRLKAIVDGFDQKAICIPIDFNGEGWREEIPSESGWYVIKTNAPLDILKSVGPKKHDHHIDFPETIRETSELGEICILQISNGAYVVYSGETQNLKARAREHVQGHPQTYCLGLSDYENISKNKKYKWTFCYMTVSDVGTRNSKTLRKSVEQAWRAEHGWPVLCKG